VFVGDLKNFVAGASYTMRQKIGQISELMDNLPGRDFVLIGDSGECDPETFGRIRDKYGARVKEIIIRKVTDEPDAARRFAGMTTIDAAPIARKKPAPVCREEP
jgi:phosphatidate phosphatase APP1